MNRNFAILIFLIVAFVAVAVVVSRNFGFHENKFLKVEIIQ